MAYIFRCYSDVQLETAKVSVQSWLTQWSYELGLGKIELLDCSPCTEKQSPVAIRFGTAGVVAEADQSTWEIFYRKLVKSDWVSFKAGIAEDQAFILSKASQALSALSDTDSSEGYADIGAAHLYASGWLQATVGFGGWKINILFSPICFVRKNKQNSENIELSQPLSLITEEKVDLKVTLKGTSISLGELKNLAVGDVIPLDHLVEQPAVVSTQTGKQVLKGQLGTLNGKRALALIK